MAYGKTAQVAANVTAVLAAQYNNLRAEVKAAAEGLQLGDDVDISIAYGGGPGSDQPDKITFVDNQNDANLDLDSVSTMSFDVNGFPTGVVSVFSKMGITLTSALTITNGKPTAIARTLS